MTAALVAPAREAASLHCACGSSLEREAPGAEVLLRNAWLKLHRGQGHELTDAEGAELARAHEDALFDDFARDPGPRRIR
jgi:hypothetical protein